jgi:hypothetical protein
MDRLLTRVATLLVEQSAFDVVTEEGSVIELWTARSDGVMLEVSAGRGASARGTRVATRLEVDGVTHRIVLLVEEAASQHPGRAVLQLRVIAALPDQSVRKKERQRLALHATLTAVSCERLAHDESLRTTVTDLSTFGFRARVIDSRVTVGDRFRLYCRSIEGAIESQARVLRCEPARLGGLTIGCELLDPSAETLWVTRRLLQRMTGDD